MTAVAGGRLEFADLTLDPRSRRFMRGDRVGRLTPTEARLLALFLRNPRVVLPRTVILREVWEQGASHSTTSLDVYIGYLRRKLESGGEPRLVHTVRGVGFVLCRPGTGGGAS